MTHEPAQKIIKIIIRNDCDVDARGDENNKYTNFSYSNKKARAIATTTPTIIIIIIITCLHKQQMCVLLLFVVQVD